MYNNDTAKQLCNLLEKNHIQKPIVFIGSAGSGKSTVGRRMAKKLRMQFYDSDKIIEEREGMTIVEIYEKYGEEYFRKREKDVIEEIISGYGRIILSTGSNAFVNPIIKEFIKLNSMSIWLYAEISILYERISRRNSRPEFNNVDIEQTLKQITEKCYPIYSEADMSVESKEYDIYKVVDDVIITLKNFLEK